MGKAEDNKKEKLERLLNTTFTLFVTRGMAKTSISDIATAAGIAKGTFYLYFQDKEDILDALVARVAHKALLQAMQGQEEANMMFADKVIHIVDSLMKQLQSDPLLMRFMRMNLNWSILRRAMKKLRKEGEGDYMDVFYRLAASDNADWDAPEVMLFTITDLVGSTCYSVLVERDPVSAEVYKPYLYRHLRSIVENHRIPRADAQIES